MSVAAVTLLDIQRKLTPDKVAYVGEHLPPRPGVRAFLTFLEYRHFTPDTPANAEYDLWQIPFCDMLFRLVAIPRSREHLAKALMAELGLRAADGVPHVIDHTGQHHFPIDQPNLFRIECVPGHFLFGNDPAQQQLALAAEAETCERVQAQHLREFVEARKHA